MQWAGMAACSAATEEHRAQGYYSNSTGLSTCAACPTGTVGAGTGLTACLPCLLPFYTAAEASRQCSSCNAGLYAVFDDVSSRTFRECLPCPAGADCPALRNMTISSLYYATRNATTLEVQTFLCDGLRCAADGACGANRPPANVNPLCGSCVSGYSEWGGQCMACSGVDGGLVLGLLLLAWTVVFLIHLLSQWTTSTSALRIAMFFWQAALLIVGRSAWLRWASVLDLNFLSVGGAQSVCPFPASPEGMLRLLLLAPLFTYLLLAVGAFVHYAVQRVLVARHDPPRVEREPSGVEADDSALTRVARRLAVELRRFQPAAYWRTSISLYFFTFNRVVRQSLDFFHCETLPSGRYMVALPAVSCDAAAYRALTPLVALLLLAYLAVVPGLIAYKLRAARGGHHFDHAELERVWSVVYGPFRSEFYWWGLAQTLLRAALVAVVVYLRANDSARLGFVTLLVSAFVVLLVGGRASARALAVAADLARHSR
jgi:hypothetical protein